MLEKMTKLAALLSLSELVPQEHQALIAEAYFDLAAAPAGSSEPECASALCQAGILIRRFSHLWNEPSTDMTPEKLC